MTKTTTEIVSEIEGLFEKATDGPWALMDGDPLSVDAHMQVFAPKCTGATSVSTLKANAALIVALVRYWPAIKEALCEWRPTQAAQDVMAERQRQMNKEGWTPEHDDEHSDGSLADAGACYAMSERAVAKVDDLFLAATNQSRFAPYPYEWPFDEEWWKPKDRRRDLVRAAALILAEIERLDRRIEPPTQGGEDE